jgi:Concanavalin A-like lectin/glucanases superfamily
LGLDGLWKLSVLEAGDNHIDIDGAGCSSTGGVSVGAWHYIAATYDGATVRFYVDGDPAGACSLSETPRTALSGTAAIGVLSSGLLTDLFDGDIDQVKFSSGAKSATAIYDYCQNVIATTISPPATLTSAAGTSSVSLSWTDTSSNEDGFNIERSTDGTSWTPIASTSANVSSFEDTGLSTSTVYYHRVRAFNSTTYSGYSNVTITPTGNAGVLALWNMNGAAGSSAKEADDGPAELNLTEFGTPTSVAGTTTPQSDGAYSLDGSTQYLTAGDTGFVTGSGARTIEAWIYRNNSSGEHDIFDYGTLAADQIWKLSILPAVFGNVMHLDIDSVGCNGSVGVSASAWHYVAATYDGTTVRFYFDGDPAGTCTLSHTPNTVLSGTRYIGDVHGISGSGEFFSGDIDLVKYSFGSKSPAAIYDYYHGI